MNKAIKPPLIAIVGPTASGKSELAVRLATMLNTVIISVDSRQIYRGMDIGTGKVAGHVNDQGLFIYKDIIHYGINLTDPHNTFTVTQFQEYARPIISNLHQQNQVPVLCGGTAHWMDAVIYQQNFPEVAPDLTLRKILEQENADQLFARLQKTDPRRAVTIDPKNKRRLIRALEISNALGTNPEAHTINSPYDVLWIGIKPSNDLTDKINTRLQERLNQGLIREVEQLHTNGLSWQRLESFGLEYRLASFYVQGLMNYQEFITRLQFAIRQYAKRQMTWWKRNKSIHWIETPEEALNIVQKFIKS